VKNITLNRETSFRISPLLLLVIALGFLGITAYGQSLFFPFVHDDVVFIQNNPDIRSLGPVFEVFLRPTYPNLDIVQTNTYYRPLVELFHRLQYFLFGLNPMWYHATNVLFHFINALLVYGILTRLQFFAFTQEPDRLRGQWVSFYAAVLFFIHPVQTEAVACVSGVSSLLFTFFLSAALFLLLRQKNEAAQHRIPWLISYGLALFLYSLSLFVKEQAIVFPFFLLAFELWRPKENAVCKKKFSAIVEVGLFFTVTVLYFLWRKHFVGIEVPQILAYPGEFLLRLASIPKTLFGYLLVIFCPVNLHYYRSVDILSPQEWGAVALLAVWFIGDFFYQRTSVPCRRLSLIGLAWFLIFLFPVLNILPLIHEYSLIAAFEHFLYFPLAGFVFFLLVLVIDRCKSGRTFKAFHWCLILLISLCTFLSIRQTFTWRAEIPLFQRVTQLEPKLARGHILMAKAYLQKGRLEESLSHFEQALWKMKAYAEWSGDSEASRYYLSMVQQIHQDTAAIYAMSGDAPSAGEHLFSALELDPQNAGLLFEMGNNLIRQNRFKEAILYFQEVLRIDQNNAGVMNNLALCYIYTGRCAEAVKLLERVLEVFPDDVTARQNLERLTQEGILIDSCQDSY